MRNKQKSEWSVHLNSNCEASTFWFIKHRKDYGSPHYVCTVAVSYYVTEAIILITTSLIGTPVDGALDAIFYVIEFIILIITWNKIPPFYDAFGIKKEIQLMLRLGAVALIIYIPYIAYRMVYGWHYIWTFFAVQFLFGIIIGICGLILNGYVFYQYFELLPTPDNTPKLPITSTTDQTDQSESRPGFGLDHSHTAASQLDVVYDIDHVHPQDQKRRDRFDTLSVPHSSLPHGHSTPTRSHSRNSSQSQSSKRRLSVFGTKEVRLNLERAYSVEDSPSPKGVLLKYVISNDELIECFLHHLAAEFSVELLLAFIEFKQFHDLMMQDHDFIDEIRDLMLEYKESVKASALDNYNIAYGLPQSCIVHNTSEKEENHNHGIQRYLTIANQLYHKYVSHGAEFEINISYLCKQRIIWFINKFPGNCTGKDEIEMNKREKYQLFTLYNYAANEMIKLMESSHARCIATNKYSSHILD